MSRTKILLWSLLALLLAAGAVAAVPGLRHRFLGWVGGEAFFAGAPASVWSARLDGDAATTNEAVEQLKRGGKPALPVLMAIGFGDYSGRKQAQSLLVFQGEAAVVPLVKVLKKSASTDRIESARILAEMGAKARPAVEALAGLLDDDDEQVRIAGMAALERLGPDAADAAPDLMVILDGKGKSKTDVWLVSAVRVLGKIGPAARVAMPSLCARLNDRNIEIVSEICLVLAAMGRDAAPAVPALIEVMKKDPAARNAAFALGKIGPGARAAVPILTTTLVGTGRSDLRVACKDALARIGPDAHSAVPALVSVFGKTAPIVGIGPAAIPELVQLLARSDSGREDAQVLLAGFRKQAVPVLVESLQKDKSPVVRSRVAGLLGPEWGDAPRLLPGLIRALADKDSTVQVAARASIVGFRRDAQPFLEQQLRGKNDGQRLEAVQLLGRQGNDGRPSARSLLLILKEEDTRLHRATVLALAKMGFHPKEAVPILIEDLKARKDIDIILPLLAEHGPGAKDALPLLCRLLADPDWKIRRQAAVTLQHVGVDKETGLAELTKATADGNEHVRAAAARALGSARLLKDEVVPVLIKLLEDKSEKVQRAAILALAEFGRGARPAVRALLKIARASRNGDFSADGTDLRTACIMALGRSGPPAQEAAPLLHSGLAAAKSDNVKIALIDALGQMQVKESAKLIEPLMRKEAGEVGVAAALALWRLGQSPPALAFLHDGLNDKSTCTACMRALGKVGPAAGKSVPLLTDILRRDPDLNRRALAAEALGGIGAVNARPALKALIAALKAPDANLRAQAARAVAVFDEDARDAASRLLDLLSDPESPQVRSAAADALLRIDPEAAANAGL